jgi:DNA-binding NarL/FixJ family response regulator
MRLIEGGNLNQKMGRFTKDLKAAVCLMTTVARAIHHAHQRGILHRDLKPSNILLDNDGNPYLTDFGLAKLIEHQSDLTLSGAVIGTLGYMAPEQARGGGKYAKEPADIFSLGVVLYSLITGHLPFRGRTPEETLLSIIEKEPKRPSLLNHRVNNDLDAVCLTCLEKDPKRRYPSAKALADDLERWLRGEPIKVLAKRAAKPIRVLLADDHTLMRAGIRALLEKLPEFEVAGEASDGREALDLIKAQQPEVVLLDISMPGLNGLEALARITRDYPQVRVIILSAHFDDECVFQALKSGASGYLIKRAAAAELQAALNSVVCGENYLSREIAIRFLKKFPLQYIARSASPLEQLTPRQREILQLIAEGQTTKAIASILKVSDKTVEYHRAKLMAGLKIFDIPGLVRFATRTGLVSQEF